MKNHHHHHARATSRFASECTEQFVSICGLAEISTTSKNHVGKSVLGKIAEKQYRGGFQVFSSDSLSGKVTKAVPQKTSPRMCTVLSSGISYPGEWPKNNSGRLTVLSSLQFKRRRLPADLSIATVAYPRGFRPT